MTEARTGPDQRIVMERPGETVSIRQLISEDAANYFVLIEYDRAHLQQHGDRTAEKYPTEESVRDSILHPDDPNKLRFGIWDGDVMVGSNNLTPMSDGVAELGTWVGKEHIGNQYAGRARSLLVEYAFAQGYDLLICNIVVGNDASRRSVEKSGFEYDGVVVDADGVEKWRFSLPRPGAG